MGLIIRDNPFIFDGFWKGAYRTKYRYSGWFERGRVFFVFLSIFSDRGFVLLLFALVCEVFALLPAGYVRLLLPAALLRMVYAELPEGYAWPGGRYARAQVVNVLLRVVDVWVERLCALVQMPDALVREVCASVRMPDALEREVYAERREGRGCDQ